ncbi:MAG: LysM peptidoglycan-binding domain-containing protein [Anaerolineae bacterium]|nr:LysM peptidoglycan-binding domain-containing protein [Anaerolineae bacterium]
MRSWPKLYYLLLALALISILTGCELARDSSEVSDMNPVEALPPTLAPLGSEETILASEATPVPTVLSVQATATPAAAASSAETTPIELAAPPAQPVEASGEGGPVAEDSAVAEAPAAEESAPAAEAEAPAQSIVVDAAAPEALPEGGPIAANPPFSDTNPVIPAASAGGNYIVQAGDTLFSISQRYGTSVEAIVAANGLTSDIVQIGQTLNIPAGDPYAVPDDSGYAPEPMPYAPGGPAGTYIVTPSDTLFSIAMRYGTSVEAIASANNIAYPYIIYEGQPLIIPGYDGAMPAPGYNPNQGYPQQPPTDGYYQQPPVEGYYQQPGQGYPQQPSQDGYYQQPGQGYTQPPTDGYYQQPPVEGYYQQPGQGYPQQPPQDGYYQQPGQGYTQPPTDGYYQQPPVEGYYQQPGQGYPQQPSQDGYYQQPGQGYSQPGQDGNAYPSPGYGVPMQPGGAGTHTVAAGETLYSIARRYGVPAEAIAAANGLSNPNQLFVGQVLYLP